MLWSTLLNSLNTFLDIFKLLTLEERKGETAAEIYCQLVSVYDKALMNRQNDVVNLKWEEMMF
jgi:hypothetical protein